MSILKIETNFRRNLFWNETKVNFNQKLGDTEKGLVNIYPDEFFQKIIGFGGAFTESSGYCLKQVNNEIAENIMDDYFTENGLNYSFCRTPVGSTDFSLSEYSYIKNDINEFSVERDEEYIIPIIKNALNKNPNLKFLSSPWSPPAFMKDTNKLIRGGKLLEKNYDLYAEYLSRYILEYKNRGININYITIQNEPKAVQNWESCIFTAEEEAYFANEYLYPKFKQKGIKTKILAWDHNKERLYSRSKEIFEIAPLTIAGMAMHWYSGDYFEEIELTRNRFPDKLLVHTEGCTGYSNFRKSDEVKNAEIYAHDMIGNLNAGVNGVIDWNMILDNQGGPNHKRNYCNAPIMLSKTNTGYIKNLTYYYIGHFSKYINQNARKIGISKYSADIETTGFKNPDSSIVIILLNRNEFNKEFRLNLNGKIFHDNLDKHAILTFVIN